APDRNGGPKPAVSLSRGGAFGLFRRRARRLQARKGEAHGRPPRRGDRGAKKGVAPGARGLGPVHRIAEGADGLGRLVVPGRGTQGGGRFGDGTRPRPPSTPQPPLSRPSSPCRPSGSA